MKLFSYKNRPCHLGPYPLERLPRRESVPDLTHVPPMKPLTFHREEGGSLVNAMRRYQGMLDAIRDGLVKEEVSVISYSPKERSENLKSFGYFLDASQVGICRIDPEMLLEVPCSNPDIDDLAEILQRKQTKTLVAGIDVIMADLNESMSAPPKRIDHHSHAIVFMYEYPRDPKNDERGCDWIQDVQAERACVRGAETVAVISNYLRLLGYEARGHNVTSSDVDLNKLAVAAGLAEVKHNASGAILTNPFVGTRFGLCAVTTTLELSPDRPLDSVNQFQRWRGPAWWRGNSFTKSRYSHTAFRKRHYKDGASPFERTKRVDKPTTLVDEPRIPRVPKRSDMFARALFGDMGKHVQDAVRNGNFVRKNPTSFAFRRPLGALALLQDGPAVETASSKALDARLNADNIKAALYFLGADAVGISRCPEWVYYSHDAAGEPINAYHPNAISVIVDQGHETMDGASGDDWISSAQSMRAYLRFSLLGGIIGDQIRELGYGARVHTVMDSDVVQPPLLLLSGLGEVSRIGEVILNPYLGPRLKSGVITTDLPLTHDKPIDFGLQNFCNNCNKCARECPAGAITAGPKVMFNGYEIWKSDSQKCMQYRVTHAAGSMCGRCMKTCPWNLEGLFAEAPFRWMATHVPRAAKLLAALDDRLGRGRINPVKKWWWDLEMVDEGPYEISRHGAEARELQTDLDLKHEDQTLAVYPANLAPDPHPFPFAMDREAGINAFTNLLTPVEYKQRLGTGAFEDLAHSYRQSDGEPLVLPVIVSKIEHMTPTVTKYEFTSPDGSPLPPFKAGDHLDIVVAPEFLRQFSLSGDPNDHSKYQIGVLRDDHGRGGSKLMHRIFREGRRVFVSRPINHFPLDETATKTLLMAGGIGVTPLMAMAHRLHAIGADFELHYSSRDRQNAGFLQDLQAAAWFHRVHLHFSSDGSRADLDAILARYEEGHHLYTCGPDRFMSAVLEIAAVQGWPEGTLHQEYFSVPKVADYENHEFTITLARSGKQIVVPPELSAGDALLAAGVHVDIKCRDGLCGVCKCGVLKGQAEHRDYVLSQAQRQKFMILCQSRASKPGGELVIDL